MNSRSIEERIREIAAKAAADNGAEFVHLEFAGTRRNPIVRVFADKEGGITIEDCSNVSRSIEAVMDESDLIASSYVLEVSSPGLDRGLYSLADFEKFAGSLAKVKMKPSFEGQSSYNGRITSVNGENIIFEDRTSGEVTIPYSSVLKANLKVDLQQELSRA